MAETQIKVMDQMENHPAPPSESAAIFSLIERAARDPSTDIDKMQRLLEMKLQMDAISAQKAFNEAMAAAQAEMPQVVRDADNDQTRSKYARYETISEAIQPIITKYGFSLTFSEGDTPKPNHIRIVCDVMHEAGHTKQYHADVPFDNVGMKGNANKTATHAYGSTKSYGRRYLKLDIFDVALKNEDDDGNGAASSSTLSAEQVIKLRDLIEAVGANEKKFLEFGRVQRLEDILASQFDAAVARLKEYGQKKGIKV